MARYVVAPEGIVSTEWPSVFKTCRRLGWGFYRWQYDAGRLILAKNAAGEYATDTTCISIPRQVGKTYLIACIIFALCLLKPGLTVIWTAHRKTTARETFDQFDGMSRRPRVAAHIRQVLHGKGDEAIHFDNGSRILFGARESGFGRGFAGVDILVCDEGQILPESVLEDLGATQNTAPNPLFFVMGTPPRPKDPGEFFTLLRQEAIDGEADATLYIETSADRGTDPMDPDQLRKANPSYPFHTTHRAMLRLRKKLKSDDSWNREARGIWDEVVKHLSPIPTTPWTDGVDIGPKDGTKPDALAVDMSHDRHISVAACWLEDEDAAHGEEVWAGVDTDAVVEWIVERAGRRIPVVVDAASPAASLGPVLRARKVRVLTTSGADMAKACGQLVDKLGMGRLTHAGQEAVDDARAGARKRAIGTAGGWGYDRRDESVDIAPLVAITLALFGALATKKQSKVTGRKPTGRRKAVVM